MTKVARPGWSLVGCSVKPDGHASRDAISLTRGGLLSVSSISRRSHIMSSLKSWVRRWQNRYLAPGRKMSRRRAPMARHPLRVECLEGRVVPDAGALDPTFGIGGKVTTDIF